VEDGRIVINCSEPCVVEMAAGFFAAVPDLTLACDKLRCAGDNAVYLWTFTGTHSGIKNHQRVVGWEQLDLDTHCKVKASRGWYETRKSTSDRRRANEAPYRAYAARIVRH
jgi:SnoaL-like polyketide cyclase